MAFPESVQLLSLHLRWPYSNYVCTIQTYKAGFILHVFNIAAFIAFLAFLTQLIVVGAVHSGVCDGDTDE